MFSSDASRWSWRSSSRSLGSNVPDPSDAAIAQEDIDLILLVVSWSCATSVEGSHRVWLRQRPLDRACSLAVPHDDARARRVDDQGSGGGAHRHHAKTSLSASTDDDEVGSVRSLDERLGGTGR